MARLTITLPDEMHRALKEAAARRGMTVAEVVEDSLDRAGVTPRESAIEVLERAQKAAAETMSGMTEDEILQWAVDEVRELRRAGATDGR